MPCIASSLVRDGIRKDRSTTERLGHPPAHIGTRPLARARVHGVLVAYGQGGETSRAGPTRRHASGWDYLPAPSTPSAAWTPIVSRSPAASMGGEAVGAVDGLVQPRLERDLGLFAALGADGGVHLPIPVSAEPASLPPGRLAGCAAFRAASGLVGEALLREELLLARGEDELAATIAAGEGLVLHRSSPRLLTHVTWNDP